MSRKRKNQTIKIHARYFFWTLRQREGVWQADGRSNSAKVGRHSLGTYNLDEAKTLVHELDLTQAVKLGLANPRMLEMRTGAGLDFEKGLDVFREQKSRPHLVNGVKPTTRKRYERINKALSRFASENSIRVWEQVCETTFDTFVLWRSAECSPRTIVTELTHFHAIHRALIKAGRLPKQFDFEYQIRRPKQSDTYCPTLKEMSAILAQLASESSCVWIYQIAVVLAYTGARFGELQTLTWDDVDRAEGFIHIRDESLDRESDRSTKTGYSREVPIHEIVDAILDQLSAKPGQLVFHGPRGGKLRNDTFGDHLRKYALVPLSSKFPHKRFQVITAHSFRHFFASQCAANGVAQQTAMGWMGHMTDAMAKYYFHSDKQSSRENIKKLRSVNDESSQCSGDHPNPPESPESDAEEHPSTGP